MHRSPEGTAQSEVRVCRVLGLHEDVYTCPERGQRNRTSFLLGKITKSGSKNVHILNFDG